MSLAPSASALYNKIRLNLERGLVGSGVTKRRNKYVIEGKNVIGLIEFQRSRDSSKGMIKFTLNIGVFVECIDEFGVEDKVLSVADCHIRQRVGMLLTGRPDLWWTINDYSDTKEISGELIRLVKEFVLPFIEKYLDLNAIRDLWESGQAPGLTEFQRLRNLARLHECQKA